MVAQKKKKKKKIKIKIKKINEKKSSPKKSPISSFLQPDPTDIDQVLVENRGDSEQYRQNWNQPTSADKIVYWTDTISYYYIWRHFQRSDYSH